MTKALLRKPCVFHLFQNQSILFKFATTYPASCLIYPFILPWLPRLLLCIWDCIWYHSKVPKWYDITVLPPRPCNFRIWKFPWGKVFVSLSMSLCRNINKFMIWNYFKKISHVSFLFRWGLILLLCKVIHRIKQMFHLVYIVIGIQ